MCYTHWTQNFLGLHVSLKLTEKNKNCLKVKKISDKALFTYGKWNQSNKEVSEEEDGEENNPQHNSSSSNKEKIPRVERGTFFVKEQQNLMVLVILLQPGAGWQHKRSKRRTQGPGYLNILHVHHTKKIILEINILEGFHEYDSWKRMEGRGVGCRSWGEAISSLWDAKRREYIPWYHWLKVCRTSSRERQTGSHEGGLGEWDVFFCTL